MLTKLPPWLLAGGAAILVAAFLLLRGGGAQAGGVLPAADGTTVPGGSDAQSGASPGSPFGSLPGYFSGEAGADQFGTSTPQDYNTPAGPGGQPQTVTSTYGQQLSGGQTSPAFVTSYNPQGYYIGGSQVAPPQAVPGPSLGGGAGVAGYQPPAFKAE